jgi:hypothetical protein
MKILRANERSGGRYSRAARHGRQTRLAAHACGPLRACQPTDTPADMKTRAGCGGFAERPRASARQIHGRPGIAAWVVAAEERVGRLSAIFGRMSQRVEFPGSAIGVAVIGLENLAIEFGGIDGLPGAVLGRCSLGLPGGAACGPRSGRSARLCRLRTDGASEHSGHVVYVHGLQRSTAKLDARIGPGCLIVGSQTVIG